MLLIQTALFSYHTTSVAHSNLSGSSINVSLGFKKIVPFNFYVLRSGNVGSIHINAIWQLQINAEFFECLAPQRLKLLFFSLRYLKFCMSRQFLSLHISRHDFFYDGKHYSFNSLIGLLFTKGFNTNSHYSSETYSIFRNAIKMFL